MILPLRRTHRRAMCALALALPVLFIAGLMARRPLVREESAGDRIGLLSPNGAEILVDARELWAGGVDAPDALIYWTAEEPDLTILPTAARLVGSLEAARHGALPLPTGGAGRGYLVLYSLAWHKPVAKAKVPKEMS